MRDEFMRDEFMTFAAPGLRFGARGGNIYRRCMTA